MKKAFELSSITLSVFILLSCASPKPVLDVEKREQELLRVEQEEVKLSAEEQQNKALEIFKEILDVSYRGRKANLDQIKDLYFKIINDYPDAPLAQESYLRLTEMYVREMKPPMKDEALLLYKDFRKKYPESAVRKSLDKTMIRFLYGRKHWDDLIAFVLPDIESFLETGELEKPGQMLLYSDAKFNLKDYKEAIKGYKIIIKYVPDSIDAKRAQKKLEEIEKILEMQRTGER